MSHLQHISAHALYLRACAKALANGDAEAREEAKRLTEQADHLDAQPKREEPAHA